LKEVVEAGESNPRPKVKYAVKSIVYGVGKRLTACKLPVSLCQFRLLMVM
jgi:hypothetical protein